MDLHALQSAGRAANLPGGLIVDRTRPRLMYALAILAWSLLTVAQGMAGRFATLFGLRMAVGLAEAPTFPLNNRVVSVWFPRQERGLATSVYIVGQYVGMAFLTPSEGGRAGRGPGEREEVDEPVRRDRDRGGGAPARSGRGHRGGDNVVRRDAVATRLRRCASRPTRAGPEACRGLARLGQRRSLPGARRAAGGCRLAPATAVAEQGKQAARATQRRIVPKDGAAGCDGPACLRQPLAAAADIACPARGGETLPLPRADRTVPADVASRRGRAARRTAPSARPRMDAGHRDARASRRAESREAGIRGRSVAAPARRGAPADCLDADALRTESVRMSLYRPVTL